MTEPTDKELEAFAIEEQFLLFCDVDEFTQIARAVLAKYGTPPVVAGEPVAWLSTDCIGERYLCFTKPKDSNPARPLVFGDTTPQPTQAQAGAVPLTDEQIARIYERYGGDMINCTRSIERHHGIRGGQHGAE